jgi:hypothetical protein
MCHGSSDEVGPLYAARMLAAAGSLTMRNRHTNLEFQQLSVEQFGLQAVDDEQATRLTIPKHFVTFPQGNIP